MVYICGVIFYDSTMITNDAVISGGDETISVEEITEVNTGVFSGPKTNTKEEECYKNGCFEDDRCYPFGYIKDKKYCDEKGIFYSENIYKANFVNQSNQGESCNQHYECKTDLCLDNICFNLTRELNSLT